MSKEEQKEEIKENEKIRSDESSDCAKEPIVVQESATDGEGNGSNAPRKYTSVNYELLDTQVWRRRKRDMAQRDKLEDKKSSNGIYNKIKKSERDRRRKYFSRSLMWIIGIIMALVGLAISIASEKLLEVKLELVDSQSSRWTAFAIQTSISAVFAFFAFLPVAVRPVSAGSGIAEAKAVLNGIEIPDSTSASTAICKGISVILAAAASLPIGLEGPMIHIGLCVGSNVNKIIPSSDAHLDTLRTDRSRRDFAAIGTAAGVSAAFYAPIGGVLFAMEEGSSFWSVLLTLRCFSAACICVMVSYLFLLFKTGLGHFNVLDLAKFNGVDGHQEISATFGFFEYFTFILFGIIGGIAGAAFCELNRALALWRHKLALTLPWKGVEVLLITIFMSALICWLPYAWRECSSISVVIAPSEHFRQLDCPDGEYNQLASLFMNPLGSIGINLLFYEEKSAFSVTTCIIAGLVYFCMTLVTFGSAISSGVFIPLLFVGACFGRAAAVALSVDNITTWAIIGSTAMLAGVVRVLISLTVIMMEATTFSYLLTPLMIVTIVSRVVGNSFGRGGIYDIILELRNVPFLEESPPKHVTHGVSTDAREVMSHTSTGFESLASARDLMSPATSDVLFSTSLVDDLVNILKENSNEDFLVLDRNDNDALVGVVARSSLLVILQHKEIFHVEGISEREVTYSELTKNYPNAPTLNDVEEKLNDDDRDKFVDLKPYVQIAPYAFDERGSSERAYELFRTLGLRYLLITKGSASTPVGIITRDNLYSMGEEKELQDKSKPNVYLGLHDSIN